jgi:hypothetical protein
VARGPTTGRSGGAGGLALGAVVTVARGRLQGVAAVAARGRSCGAASRW